MVKWEAFVHDLNNGQYAVMIRNHKTSHGLVCFAHRWVAIEQAIKINRYPFAKKVELYQQAMRENILCLRHEDLDFKSRKLERFEYHKGAKCWYLTAWVKGRRLPVKRERYKKDLKDWLDRNLAEYGEQVILETTWAHYRPK